MRTMGRPGAKTKSSPTKPVVKAAAKKIAQAAAKAKSVAKAKAKAAVKVKVESPSPQKSPSLQEMVPVSQAASVDKKDISNFLGQMKRATSDDAVALYQHYKTLGKFDAQKQTLIAKWKADKSCQWYSSYSESFEKQFHQEASCCWLVDKASWGPKFFSNTFYFMSEILCPPQVGDCQ